MSVTEITNAIRRTSYEQLAVWCALAALVLGALTGMAALVAALPPILAAAPVLEIVRPAGAVEGVLQTSDGKTFSGVLSTPGGKPLRILELGDSRFVDISLREIARIDVAVQEEREEPYWYWKGDGDQRVYTGSSYPWHKYIATVTLPGGRSVAGDLDGLIYVEVPSPAPEPALQSTDAPQETGPRKLRFVFRSRQTGVEGQKAEDLLYVTSVAVQQGHK